MKLKHDIILYLLNIYKILNNYIMKKIRIVIIRVRKLILCPTLQTMQNGIRIL